jgi:hypothetical protein
MLKFKYFRHPIRTSKAANALVKARLSMRSSAAHGRRYYRDDPRYNLQSVTDGFAFRLDTQDDDSELLERICAAYIKTVQHPQPASDVYKATDWWEEIRQRSLKPVIQALISRDIEALRRIYRNFFRDPCSTGLVNVPNGMSKAYFGGTIKDVHRHFYLSDSLRRLDYWSLKTQGRCAICELSGPKIGNPFGIYLNDTLIRAGATYQHYCAHRISSILSSAKPVVAEIGGGFGGMAYYLLRDRAGLTYFDFDVPESIALTSYYLSKAFPQLQIRLFGESDATTDRAADVLLMPLSELSSVFSDSFDIVFSSHAMSDLSSNALQHYLHIVGRVTRDLFLYVGNSSTVDVINKTINRHYPLAAPVEINSSAWNDYANSSNSANELECLYRFKDVRRGDRKRAH